MSLLPYALARPFLFGLDPETAHELTLHTLARVQGTPLAWAYCNRRVEDPVVLAGLKFPNRVGLAAASYMALGTDVVEELEQLCLAVARDYPRCTAFAGQLVFQRDSWYQHLLHNQTAFAVQRRLQWGNVPMVILPTRVK